MKVEEVKKNIQVWVSGCENGAEDEGVVMRLQMRGFVVRRDECKLDEGKRMTRHWVDVV